MGLRSFLRDEQNIFVAGFKKRIAPVKIALVSCFVVSFVSGFHEYGLVAFFRSYALSVFGLKLNKAVPFVLAIIGVPYTFLNVPLGYTLSERFGSRRMMIVGQVFMFLYSAFGVLTCAFSFCLYPWKTNHLLVFTLFFFSFGLVFVNVNFIPIVLEQVPNQGSDERSSCVHWSWFFFYSGRLSGTIASSSILSHANPVHMFTLNLFMSVVALVILSWVPLERFMRDTKLPLVQIWTVLKAVLKHVKCRKKKVEEEIRYHSESRYRNFPPNHKPSIFEKVSKDFGGQLVIEDVRDVQKFFLITLIICSCIGIYIIYSLLSTAYVPEVSKMRFPQFLVNPMESFKIPGQNRTIVVENAKLPVSWLSSISDITTVSVIAFLDLLVYPRCFHRLNTRRRIFIGTVFGFLASLSAVVTEWIRITKKDDLYFYMNRMTPFYSAPAVLYSVENLSSMASLPQYFFYGLMVAFVQPGVTELALLEAPIRMRRLLFALMLSVLGAAQVLGAVVILTQFGKDGYWCFFCNHKPKTGIMIFVMTPVLTFVLLGVYGYLSRLYNRFERLILVPYNPEVPDDFSRTPLFHLDH